MTNPTRRKKHTQLNNQIVDYLGIAALVLFVFIIIGAIITTNVRMVFGSIILILALGFIFYTGIKE